MRHERIIADAEHITRTHQLLTHAARRAQEKPTYVAFALSRYQTRHGLTDEALAKRLGCDSLMLPHLSLCLAPRPEHRAEDLAQIANKLGLDPQILSAMLTEEGQTWPRPTPLGKSRRLISNAMGGRAIGVMASVVLALERCLRDRFSARV